MRRMLAEMLVKKVVLLAEDDHSHEALFRRAVDLSAVSCRLDVVRDGVEVIDYLFGMGEHAGRERRNLPDLILLDLNMPRMNGIQVLKVLRRVCWEDRSRVPPVVVLTGSYDDHDVAEAYQWGAQSYICKPGSFPELAHAVRETLDYWLGLNRSVRREPLGVPVAPERR